MFSKTLHTNQYGILKIFREDKRYRGMRDKINRKQKIKQI
jgi:hypothetical protein